MAAGGVSTRWIHWTTATIESTNDDAEGEDADGRALLRAVRFPKNRISTNEAAGIAGMIQP